VFGIASDRRRLGYLSMLSSSFDLTLSLAYRAPDHPAAVLQAFDLVSQRKALVGETSRTQREAVLMGKYAMLRPQLEALAALRARIAQKTLAGPLREALAQHRATLGQWNKDRERLEAELARQIPELRVEHFVRAAGYTTLTRALPPGSAFVEFVQFGDVDFTSPLPGSSIQETPLRYLALVVQAEDDEGPRLVDLGPAAHIDQLIAAYRAAITGEPSYHDQRNLRLAGGAGAANSRTSSGRRLRAALFDPLRLALGDCKRLFLAPDGDLARMPFGVLPSDTDALLIEEYEISYLSTGRDLLRFGRAIDQHASAPLVAADPDFELAGPAQHISSPAGTSGLGWRTHELARASEYFTPLPGTRREGMTIAELLGVEPLLGGAVLDQRIKASRSPCILHIATHGFFLPSQQWRMAQPHNMAQPGGSGLEHMRRAGDAFERLADGLESPMLRSGLALAGANTWLSHDELPPEAEDGILTAEDVAGMDLSATQLVVLSACDTGLGEISNGEGVFGLRRAFVLAGAQTLIMSLWKVPDTQTQELMVDFYQRLLAGASCSEALCEAQLILKARYPEPYYWGAFICQGDPGPLKPDIVSVPARS
jgi:CHAT domain-containing protein